MGKSTLEVRERVLDLERTGWQAATRSEAGTTVHWWVHISRGQGVSLTFLRGQRLVLTPACPTPAIPIDP